VQIVNRNVALADSGRSELRSAAFYRAALAGLSPGDRLRIVRRREEAQLPVNPVATEYSPQESFYAAVARVQGIDAQVVTADYRARPGDFLAWCGPVVPNLDRLAGALRASRGSCRLVSVHPAGSGEQR
jgi:hypothetical protein